MLNHKIVRYSGTPKIAYSMPFVEKSGINADLGCVTYQGAMELTVGSFNALGFEYRVGEDGLAPEGDDCVESSGWRDNFHRESTTRLYEIEAQITPNN